MTVPKIVGFSRSSILLGLIFISGLVLIVTKVTFKNTGPHSDQPIVPTKASVSFRPLDPTRSSQATGPLRVNPANPRYFTDGTGGAIYLTGSHTWSNLQDNGESDPPPIFDYIRYLDFLQAHNHNFFRLWVWEEAKWTSEIAGDYWIDPMPFQRRGPGTALDGKPKFDLTLFNQHYFDRIRQRVAQAGSRGIYVSIMLFNGFSIQNKAHLNNPWRGHPFNVDNNVNGIDGDSNKDGEGEEIHTLQNPAITALQETYVRKVVDTVNDLDNVLFEISNESHGDSCYWQYHMIKIIKEYERGKTKQHPIGMTVEWPRGDNFRLFASQAEWISPDRRAESKPSAWYLLPILRWIFSDRPPSPSYLSDPPESDGRKVIINDADHLGKDSCSREWVWESFLRGLNPVFMDSYDGKATGLGAAGFNASDPKWESLRLSLGYTLTYANRMNLVAMTPQNNLASTSYCLANPVAQGAEYLVYRPSNQGRVTVNLSATSGQLKVEWFNPGTGLYIEGGMINGGASRELTSPFSGDAVLHILQR